jgi:hypothetical protein
MERGLGIWTETASRFYPVSTLKENGNAVLDTFGGEGLLVALDPKTDIPFGLYIETEGFSWDGDILRLSTGESIREGTVFSSKGSHSSPNRPLQLFTRWYGFSYTFPGCEIFSSP